VGLLFGDRVKFKGRSGSFGFAQDDTIFCMALNVVRICTSYTFAQDDTGLLLGWVKFKGRSRSFGFAQDDTGL